MIDENIPNAYLAFPLYLEFAKPLQYLKSVRLHKALLLMVHEGVSAGTAATRVGYESASQFSREFKQRFGNGPATAAADLRKAMIRLA